MRLSALPSEPLHLPADPCAHAALPHPLTFTPSPHPTPPPPPQVSDTYEAIDKGAILGGDLHGKRLTRAQMRAASGGAGSSSSRPAKKARKEGEDSGEAELSDF